MGKNAMRGTGQWYWGLVLLSIMNLGCRRPEPEANPDKAQEEQGALVVTLTAGQQAAIGLTTARAVEKEIQPVLESFGRVIPRLQGRVQITSPVAGRITPQSMERIPAPGAAVRKGQVLAEVEQTYTASERVQLGVGEEGAGGAAQEAKAALAAAAAEYHRSERLWREKIVSRKRVEEAKAAWLQAQSRFETARRQEKRYHTATAAGKESLRRFPLVAPIDGVVVQADITAGQQVDVATPLFIIADLSTVWVEAPVFEGDIDKIDVKRPAAIRGVGHGAHALLGRPIYAGEVVDPLKRTASLLYEVENTDGALKLGMSVTVALPTGAPRLAVMAPAAALIEREDGKGVVYVRQSPTTFVEQTVKIGPRQDGFVAIESGVSAGAEVVVTGAAELFGAMPGRLAVEE
ncbi:MAG TPA: efflux RND transporter periplasmic adaptor subunit [Methylomirabilota bacterium]|nr:efflux RND transporter periplasmic adaptor subunit [Methylomirabilota bacterium]